MHIYAAQLEVGTIATDYLDSGATTAKAGVLIDLPRINYDANGENGALLLEPSRQQLIQHSEYFGDSSWDTFSGATLGSSFVKSPEGLNNAYTLNFASGNESLVYYNYSSGSATFTTSVWARSDSGKKFCFRHWDGTNAQRSADFTTTTEWQRFDYTLTSPIINFGICNQSAGGVGSIEIYGFQAEAGSYATSYIPNHGESGGVTRAADSECDILNLLSNGIISSATEWTIFFDVEGISDTFNTSDGQFFSGQGSTLDVYIRPGNTSQEYIRFYWRKDSKYIGSTFGRKICARLSGGTGTTFVDGTLNGSSSISGDYSSLGFARNPNLPGYVNKIIFFPTALTDAECITLTTL